MVGKITGVKEKKKAPPRGGRLRKEMGLKLRHQLGQGKPGDSAGASKGWTGKGRRGRRPLHHRGREELKKV